jgi:hypothetical protein
MAHYLIDGKKYPAVERPLTGEIMYGEKAVGKDLKEFSGVEQMVMSALISLRRDPEARVRYNWDTLMEIPFDQLVPISDAQDEQPVEMVPDPTARGERRKGPTRPKARRTPHRTPVLEIPFRLRLPLRVDAGSRKSSDARGI